MKPSDEEILSKLVRDLVCENDRAVKQALKNYADNTPANPDNGAMWETCFGVLLHEVLDPLLAEKDKEIERLKRDLDNSCRWACGHENSGVCRECHLKRIAELEAEVKLWKKALSWYNDPGDGDGGWRMKPDWLIKLEGGKE